MRRTSRDAVDKVMTAMRSEAEDIGDDLGRGHGPMVFNVDDAPPRLIRENDLAALTGPGARGGSFGSAEGAGDLARFTIGGCWRLFGSVVSRPPAHNRRREQ